MQGRVARDAERRQPVAVAVLGRVAAPVVAVDALVGRRVVVVGRVAAVAAVVDLAVVAVALLGPVAVASLEVRRVDGAVGPAVLRVLERVRGFVQRVARVLREAVALLVAAPLADVDDARGRRGRGARRAAGPRAPRRRGPSSSSRAVALKP